MDNTAVRDILMPNVSMVLKDWLEKTSLPNVKAIVVKMCLLPKSTQSHSGQKEEQRHRVRFETMAGETIASNDFSKTSTGRELHAYVRQHILARHNRGASDTTSFTLCYGTFEISNHSWFLLTDVLKKKKKKKNNNNNNGIVVAIVFLARPNYSEFKCLKTVSGHQGGVVAIAFSHDGEAMLSSSWDCTVALWSTKDCSLLKKFMEHSSLVKSVAFNLDGTTVLSASNASGIKLWSIATGMCIKTVPVQCNLDFKIVFSLDGNTALSAVGGNLLLLDLNSETRQKTFSRPKSYVPVAAFSPDGKTVASGFDDGVIQLFSIESTSCLRTFSRHRKPVVAVAFSPDSSNVVSGSNDKTLKLWKETCVRKFSEHTAPIDTVSFSPDGTSILSSAGDWTAKVWSVETGSSLNTLYRSSCVLCAAFAPDGRSIWSGDDSGSITVWGTPESRFYRPTRRRIDYGRKWVTSTRFS